MSHSEQGHRLLAAGRLCAHRPQRLHQPRRLPLAGSVALAALALLASAPVGAEAPRAQPVPQGASRPSAESLARLDWSGLEFRQIGPWRGGRSVAIVGHPTDDRIYYQGTASGGLWRTQNAGLSWEPVGDDAFRTSAVGAVDIAPSNPDHLVVGMGEHSFRGVASSQGDGVYLSRDGGKTFTHVGLTGTRQIASVKFHPRNPDIIWVAAQGNSWVPSEDRGVYKTTDGGRTWRRVLAGANPTTGAADLKLDPLNPDILYATLWDHQRLPWQIRSGGPGSGLYRSTDGGETWQPINDGLPELKGKMGIAPSGAKAGLVYAVVEALDKGGVYRSDDGGQRWTHVNGTRRVQARSWYYMEIYADPKAADTVYVMMSDFLKSTDGGKEFAVRPMPHVDHHDLWINPRNPDNIANANDGGATITFDGGKSWSSIQNQPTGQFYRVAVDNGYPYRIYSAQQDATTIAILSRAPDGKIGREDWKPVGGNESGFVVPDPHNPRYVYAGGFLGMLTEYDHDTDTIRFINPYPELKFGTAPRDRRYRFNWNAPIIASARKPGTLYHAANVVFRSTDRGLNWTAISPDLTRAEPETMGPMGGPITNETSEVYATISALAESPHDGDELWAGSDDGRLHLTRDGGRTWQELQLPDSRHALINLIELSPHQPGTAYVVMARYKLGDDRPYLFTTADWGRTWQRRDSGLDPDAFLRVVREDPVRPGLLFAGTERGLSISFDQGRSWAPFRQNLPAVPVTDIAVAGADLVLATQGRGLFVLDDYSPLRHAGAAGPGTALHLYPPQPARHWQTVSSEVEGEAQNPFNGALIHYRLSAAAAAASARAPLRLEIRNSAGELVRLLESSEKVGADGGGQQTSYALPRKPGLNRATWDLTITPVTRLEGVYAFTGGPDQITPGPRVPPGTYSLTLSVGRQRVGPVPLSVTGDRRLPETMTADPDHQTHVMGAYAMLNALRRSVLEVADLRRQLAARPAGAGRDELLARIDRWDDQLVSRRPEYFQDVLNWPQRLDGDLEVLLFGLGNASGPVPSGARGRYAELEMRWREAEAERDAIVAAARSLLGRSAAGR